MSDEEEWQPTFEKATPLHIGPSSVVVDGAEYVRKPPDRAWEEVDRWNAEQAGNPRDRARDQLADAGVVVQRQFRSDQERIAELEHECDLRATESASANELISEIKARSSRVPALVEALRKAAAWLENGPPGELNDSWPLLEAIRTALAEWEKP